MLLPVFPSITASAEIFPHLIVKIFYKGFIISKITFSYCFLIMLHVYLLLWLI